MDKLTFRNNNREPFIKVARISSVKFMNDTIYSVIIKGRIFTILKSQIKIK